MQWWNPATDKQALERVYRIGQTRETQMRVLCTKGSIEEKILALQERKQTLANALLRDKASAYDVERTKKASLSRDELEELIGVAVDTGIKDIQHERIPMHVMMESWT